MIEKNILFYQANFDPEVNRLLKALNENNQKDVETFKLKTLVIINEILNKSNNFAEIEEWSAIQNLVEQSEFIDSEEKEILSKYGIPFSEKFMFNNMCNFML